jgi:hypothetical protein
MPEPRLTPLPAGKLKIHAEHFRKVVRRIEAIKPLAGDNISIRETEDGIEISSTGTAGGTGTGVPAGFSVIELHVCRNGAPGTIQVLGYDPIGYTDL